MKHSIIVHRLYQQHKTLTRDLNRNTIQKHWERVKGRKQCILRIEKYYKEVISFDLVLQCCVDGVMEIRPPQKIVLSTSSKRLVQDQKELVVGLSALKMISGQKSQSARARKSIAAFKLREGSVLGCKTTLRRKAIYSFLDKLIFLVLPRARASLVSRNMDANNNYNIGISDPFVFMELENHYDLYQSLQGINIALVNSNLPSNRLSLPLLGNLAEPSKSQEARADQRSAGFRSAQELLIKDEHWHQISAGSTKQKATSPNDSKIFLIGDQHHSECISIPLLLSGLQIQVD